MLCTATRANSSGHRPWNRVVITSSKTVAETIRARSRPGWFLMVAAAVGIGALWGAVFGFAAHAATKGQRDFSSVRSLAASRYDLIARDGTAERARGMLAHVGLIPAEVPDPATV